MNYYIGIDLGTSSIKGILVAQDGNIVKTASREYAVSYPKPLWSEQNPQDWLFGMDAVLNELTAGVKNDVKGISFAGQMHGLVMLDENDEVIRPCILWNDGRSFKEVEYLNSVQGTKKLTELTGNIAYAGFTAPKILWVYQNEPQNFAKISKIMLPKDYLVYKLTGAFSCDYSDASGMLLLDVKNKRWAEEMLEICHVQKEWLPTLYESYEVVGKPKSIYALPNAVVTAGAGDNAAAAIGTGTVCDGNTNISLGTSGTVFISADKFSVDKDNGLHSFAHANGAFHQMGCILSAASCNKWWIETILGLKDYAFFETSVRLGENRIYFLPYLTGERSPINDVNASGTFIGLRADTTKEEMTLAVMEGITFALRECVEIARRSVTIDKVTVCGGGAKSEIWRKIIANVLNVDVYMPVTEQGPSYGAAILAMVGANEHPTTQYASERFIKKVLCSSPDVSLLEKYEEKYQAWKNIYPALKEVYKRL